MLGDINTDFELRNQVEEIREATAKAALTALLEANMCMLTATWIVSRSRDTSGAKAHPRSMCLYPPLQAAALSAGQKDPASKSSLKHGSLRI